MDMLRRFSQAAEQSGAMADALGVDDPRGLVRDPELEAARLRNRIFRCAWCANHEDCAARLASGGLSEAPEYCRNKAEFDAAQRALATAF